MHSDLSPHLHTEECNLIIKKLIECHENNKLAKFLGACNDLDRAMTKCLGKEKERKRQLNLDRSRLKHNSTNMEQAV